MKCHSLGQDAMSCVSTPANIKHSFGLMCVCEGAQRPSLTRFHHPHPDPLAHPHSAHGFGGPEGPLPMLTVPLGTLATLTSLFF